MDWAILLLTHNRLDAVRRCFEGLLPTTAGRATVYVLDNASTDGTAEYVAGLADRCEVAFSPHNQGVAGGRATLMRTALRGEADQLCFLDSDVIVRNGGWLDALSEALTPHEVGVAGSLGSYVNWTADGLVGYTPAPAGACDVVAGWCLAFKRRVIWAGCRIDLRFGPFWEEDSDFCLQAREKGFEVVCAGDIGLAHSPGLSGGVVGRQQRLRLLRAKWYGRGLTRAEGGY